MKKLYYKTHVRREFFKSQFEIQGGACLICGKEKRLVIDHNRQTGEMRGLLCYTHNTGLGMFQDDPTLLRKAADYLDQADHEISIDNIGDSIPTQRINDELVNILNDSTYISDRARARHMVTIYTNISEGAMQTRLSRMRRKGRASTHDAPMQSKS